MLKGKFGVQNQIHSFDIYHEISKTKKQYERHNIRNDISFTDYFLFNEEGKDDPQESRNLKIGSKNKIIISCIILRNS